MKSLHSFLLLQLLCTCFASTRIGTEIEQNQLRQRQRMKANPAISLPNRLERCGYVDESNLLEKLARLESHIFKNPYDFKSYMDLGRLYRVGFWDDEKAKEVYERLIDLKPSHLKGMLALADLIVLDDPDRARLLANEVYRQTKKNISRHEILCAIPKICSLQICSRQREFSDLIIAVADIHTGLDNFEEATILAQKALSLDPTNDDALNSMAFTLYCSGPKNWKKVVELIDKSSGKIHLPNHVLIPIYTSDHGKNLKRALELAKKTI